CSPFLVATLASSSAHPKGIALKHLRTSEGGRRHPAAHTGARKTKFNRILVFRLRTPILYIGDRGVGAALLLSEEACMVFFLAEIRPCRILLPAMKRSVCGLPVTSWHVPSPGCGRDACPWAS